jgi:hypothetical protein
VPQLRAMTRRCVRKRHPATDPRRGGGGRGRARR